MVPTNQVRFGLIGKQDVHRENFQGGPYDKLASRTYSFAIEDDQSVNEALVLTIGVSYDLFDKVERRQDDKPGAKTGDNLDAFSPIVGLKYTVSNDVDIYGSYARKVRFPTMRNLYADGVIGPQGFQWHYYHQSTRGTILLHSLLPAIPSGPTSWIPEDSFGESSGRPEFIATTEDVKDVIDGLDTDSIIVDDREWEEFTGESNSYYYRQLHP